MRPTRRVPEEAIARIIEGLRDSLIKAPEPKLQPQAQVIAFPPKFTEQDLIRRQQVIDAVWERTCAERERLEAEARRTCHVGPDDPDYRLR
jgi:hypothetical protein